MTDQANFNDQQQEEVAHRRGNLILKRIGELQREKGRRVTKGELARRARITRQEFYKIINAKTITPKTSTLYGLEKALEFKHNELLRLTYGFLNGATTPKEAKVVNIDDIMSLRKLSEKQVADEVEHCARVLGNLDLLVPILPIGNCMVVYPGCTHLVMGERSAISENLGALADVARISPHGHLLAGTPSEPIDVGIISGSALSNRLTLILDRHSSDGTLKRIGPPMIGSFVNEFDTSRQDVRVYINGEQVLEPARRIVDESGRKQQPIFEPKLQHGVPQQDAIVLKVVRSCSNAPSLLLLAGWGPAGTLHGFKMLLENRSILSQLAKFASESFEVLIVVDGVRTEEVDGQMTATGPLHIVGSPKRIQVKPEEDARILAAFKALPSEPPRLWTANEIRDRSLVCGGFLPHYNPRATRSSSEVSSQPSEV